MDDLIGEFITETSESLSELDLELVKLEQNPNDKEILGNIFRLVHTIKGTCGFLGLPRLESVAHAGENILGKIRDCAIEVTPDVISIVLEALDCIKGLIEYLSEHSVEPAGDNKSLIDRLNAFAADGATGALGQNEIAGVQSAVKIATLPQKEIEKEIYDGEASLDELERLFQETEVTVTGAEAAESYSESKAATFFPESDVSNVIEKDLQAAKAGIAQKVKEQKEKRSAVEPEKMVSKDASVGGNLANQSIRVNLQVIDNLMQMVGELVLTRNQLMQIVRSRDDNELKSPLQHLSHITTELQEGVMKTRMQPIGNAWAKFPRLIRDLSIELEKKIELRMEGAETELDRQLLEFIKDPLTHMVRNSCDHGLEGPSERITQGKPEAGVVTLSAYHEGGHIIIKIVDDGRGVNIDRIMDKALENGITTQSELTNLSDQQIMQFIFRPGFSTAEKVTSVSGRGVGMDVVRTNIEKIGGNVELSSTPGKGSTFHIKIPLTLAIVSVLIVESEEIRFAIPQINVIELVRSADDSEYKIEDVGGAKVLRLRDKLLPLIELSAILELPPIEKNIDENEFAFMQDVDEKYIVVCMVGGNEFGLIVDKIYDTEEIVVKPVSTTLAHIDLYSGNTILGDGNVIMILDPNGISRIVNGPDVRTINEDNLHYSHFNPANERQASFLIFAVGENTPKAVPLELVSRLEEIDMSHIEYSGGKPVIQYRDDLMRLITLPMGEMKTSGISDVIVFTYDNKTVGLVVDDILDIVAAPISLKLSSEEDRYLGSMVIDGRTTDVVDVGYLLRDLVGDVSILSKFDQLRATHECKLLFVEDSMFFRRLTVPFLKNAGYYVTDVSNAKEALSLLKKGEEFDVIVTDIEMPEIDGFSMAERIREMDAYDSTPIVAFTSTINKQFIARSKYVGMQDIILKTDREALIRSIYHQLTLNERQDTSYA